MSTSEPNFTCDGSNFAADCVPFKSYALSPSPNIRDPVYGVFERNLGQSQITLPPANQLFHVLWLKLYSSLYCV
jgi:hypothetical protein